MASLEYIPLDDVLDTDIYFERTASLDGEDFIFTFMWNEIDQHIFLTIKTSDGSNIIGCTSIRLVNGLFILKRVRDANRPKGQLFIYGDSIIDPTLSTIGRVFKLYYIPKELFDEWIASTTD